MTILEIQSSAGFSLGSTLGTARVAWRAGTSLPVVQCVRVKRAGNAISGLRVELLASPGGWSPTRTARRGSEARGAKPRRARAGWEARRPAAGAYRRPCRLSRRTAIPARQQVGQASMVTQPHSRGSGVGQRDAAARRLGRLGRTARTVTPALVGIGARGRIRRLPQSGKHQHRDTGQPQSMNSGDDQHELNVA